MNKIEKIITHWEQPSHTSIYFFNSESGSMCRLTMYDGDNYGIISDLYVNPSYWHNGIGSQLIKECEDEIHSKCVDYSKICVTKNTLQTDELLKYYIKRGYTIFESNGEQYIMLKPLFFKQ